MDRRIFGVLAVFSLVFLLCLPINYAAAPDIPGVPSDAVAYNHPGIVPTDFPWSITAETPTVLSFENFVLMVDSSENLELNFTVGSDVAMQYFSLSLVPGESISLNIDVTVTPPSGVGVAEGGIDIYVYIEPDETVTVDATLGLYIDETAIEERLGRDIDFSRLTWAYWDGSNWVPVESQIDANGYLVAQTTHFSTWTIIETPAPIPWALYGGIVAVVVVVAAVAAIAYRRKRIA